MTTFGLVRAALQTGTGTQEFTDANMGGVTPNAAFFWITAATTEATRGTHMIVGYGACDGTRQWCVMARHRDGVTTTAAIGRATASAAIAFLDPVLNSVAFSANFSAFISNGVRINITNADSSGYFLHVLLIETTNVYANIVELNTGNTPVVESIGFAADAVLAAGLGASSLDANYNHGPNSMGFASRDGGSVRQHAIGVRSRSSQATTDVVTAKQDQIVSIPDPNVTSLGFAADVSFGATDITFTMDTGVGTADIQVGYFAFQVDDGEDWSGEIQVNNLTTTVTGVGFQPQVVIGLMSFFGAGDQLASSGTAANSHGLVVMTETTEFSTSLIHRDGVSTTEEESWSESLVKFRTNGGETFSHSGTGPAGSGSFDADGFTIEFTTTSGGVYWPFLALGGAPPAPRAQWKLGNESPAPGETAKLTVRDVRAIKLS